MMTTWFLLGGFVGAAVLGAAIFHEACNEIGRLIAERRDLIAENKFLKMTDDELAELILADARDGRL
ncbi:hypothetical protein [Sinorhizobium psoraleae]|uniref:Uncharacterized protein n=1 Tax=Sinorhizobium psoraleae TaxID=520838 RepID=A0ABT4KBZ9_9HYPH|nr:hypothetical protein [Sinorhizobium psoraleae]MCZ4089355.1 hypothetical protein [Sinorhizobium psoraleae]